MKIKIAIDGYSSCGKSTLAKDLAKALKYTYIDTGAMYRAITLYFLRNTIDIENEDAIENAIKNIHIRYGDDEEGRNQIFLNEENVSEEIRSMHVANKVSEVASKKAVRRFAVAQQRALGKNKGVIMDGRDIGNIVFPDAELKIFMTANEKTRIQRRYAELRIKNPEITLEEVKENIQQRDYIDTHREESPLRQSEDAKVLDNSNLNREEQLQLVLEWVDRIIEEIKNED
ncbi:MAG TPA: (d)CMP kinase [Chitinophagaceae bacterium]|nr:(d)CMP kinase [Chitinophagaceae bacterium]